jgi:hypothetical protein
MFGEMLARVRASVGGIAGLVHQGLFGFEMVERVSQQILGDRFEHVGAGFVGQLCPGFGESGRGLCCSSISGTPVIRLSFQTRGADVSMAVALRKVPINGSCLGHR